MHIYFSGIGGHAIGPLALIARQAGYQVSGSDRQQSRETDELVASGIDVHIGQTADYIAGVHTKKPIDWFVYSSSLPSDHPELSFAREHNISLSKRDQLLNTIIKDKELQLVAIAGTHGKSTATAMVIWLCKALDLPISYSVGAAPSFGPMGQYQSGSTFFIYECDEFDRNFLAFHPDLSAITGIAWDHHEIFPTADNYNQAFRDFISQSKQTIAWRSDLQRVGLQPGEAIAELDAANPAIDQLQIIGRFNREDAWLALHTVSRFTNKPIEELTPLINRFPGLRQRMELLAPNLYTNYAHTPEKIKGGMSAARELAAANGQNLVVIYEPLTNRRQYYIKDEYQDSFAGANKMYWVPTYLAREDPTQAVLTPAELIPYLSDPSIAEPAALDNTLEAHIKDHLAKGDLVVAMGATGAGSLDEWLRRRFTNQVSSFII